MRQHVRMYIRTYSSLKINEFASSHTTRGFDAPIFNPIKTGCKKIDYSLQLWIELNVGILLLDGFEDS